VSDTTGVDGSSVADHIILISELYKRWETRVKFLCVY